MAVNPMQLMKLKDRYRLFKEDHPKMMPFLTMLGKKAVEEGTVITIKAVTPEGQEYESNIRLTRNDVQTVRTFIKS